MNESVENQEQYVLTKETFKRRYAAERGVTIKEAELVYDLVFGYVKETIDNDGKVRIPGVGVLFVDDIEAKEYPIPGTDKKVQKPARKRVKLSAKPFEV